MLSLRAQTWRQGGDNVATGSHFQCQIYEKSLKTFMPLNQAISKIFTHYSHNFERWGSASAHEQTPRIKGYSGQCLCVRAPFSPISGKQKREKEWGKNRGSLFLLLLSPSFSRSQSQRERHETKPRRRGTGAHFSCLYHRVLLVSPLYPPTHILYTVRTDSRSQ